MDIYVGFCIWIVLYLQVLSYANSLAYCLPTCVQNITQYLIGVPKYKCVDARNWLNVSHFMYMLFKCAKTTKKKRCKMKNKKLVLLVTFFILGTLLHLVSTCKNRHDQIGKTIPYIYLSYEPFKIQKGLMKDCCHCCADMNTAFWDVFFVYIIIMMVIRPIEFIIGWYYNNTFLDFGHAFSLTYIHLRICVQLFWNFVNLQRKTDWGNVHIIWLYEIIWDKHIINA